MWLALYVVNIFSILFHIFKIFFSCWNLNIFSVVKLFDFQDFGFLHFKMLSSYFTTSAFFFFNFNLYFLGFVDALWLCQMSLLEGWGAEWCVEATCLLYDFLLFLLVHNYFNIKVNKNKINQKVKSTLIQKCFVGKFGNPYLY